MQFLVLIGAASSLLSLSGELAFLEDGTVSVVDLSDGSLSQVGPGPEDGPPCWSLDGAWLAFEASAASGRDIYVVRTDGSDGRRLGVAGAWNTAPAWSTDGTSLVYLSAPAPDAPGQIRVVNLNTGEDNVWGGGRAGFAAPKWLLFSLLLRSLNPDQQLEISGVDMPRFLNEAHMHEADLKKGTLLPDTILAMAFEPKTENGQPLLGTSIVLVTRSEVLPIMALADPSGEMSDGLTWGVTANWTEPRIEPLPASDRTFGNYAFKKLGATDRVAFESNLGGDREIYVLGKRGIANVTNHRSADWNPVWSPDGKIVAFESFRSGRRGVYRLYADTAHIQPIAVRDDGDCWSPAWSPDGEHLAYVSNATGQPALYVVSLNGGDALPVPSEGASKEAPAWRPVLP